ncbi:uncharacterized protein LOC142550923 [Primulina tabacum]|uniref:uncharacterized protein LOC142550923 n=1 Tax=Primulina tabacum TaxID=48773 RepID=UPI003F59EC27
MGRGDKYPLSFLDHFQICCPKNPNSLVRNLLPAVTCMFSPVNSRSCDISFPSSQSHPTSDSRGSSEIKSLGNCESRSKSCTKHKMIGGEFRSNGYSKPIVESKMKMYNNSPVSSESDENNMAIVHSQIEKISKKTVKKKSKARFYSSISSPTSFNSSCSYSHPLNTTTEEHLHPREKMMQQKHIGPRRFKRFGSQERKHDELTVPLRESAERKPISERLMPHIVVKRSVDPYWDFKRSMLEMIWDQKMSDPKEMENLLMSFLSLNSTQHHKVIIEAFAEIWKEMYRGSWN